MSVKHTEKCATLLPLQVRYQFPVLAQVMEKAPIFWAILLSPVIWAFMNKHYVIGVDAKNRTLHLFRCSMGMVGLGKVTNFEQLAVADLRDLEFRNGLFTAAIVFTKPDGAKIKLFAPNPSKENANEVYQMIQQARVP